MSKATGALGLLIALLGDDPNAPGPETAREWDALLRMAGGHLLLAALWVSLRDRGRVRSLPDSARVAIEARLEGRNAPEIVLERAYAANVTRQRALVAAGRRALDTIEAVGIRVVPLKGLHTLAVGLWRDPGARTMVDVDVLVNPGDGRAAFRALEAEGFLPAPEAMGEFADHQLQPLQDEQGVHVEIHEHLVRRRWDRLLHAPEVLAAARPVDGPLGARLAMSTTHAVVTLIAHAQLQDETYARLELPLRALVETQRWIADRSDEIDWDEVAARFAAVDERHALAAHALAANRLFDTRLAPALVSPRLRARAHHRLVLAALDAPAAHRLVVYFHDLPRSFRRERMIAEFGPPSGAAWLWRKRLRHVGIRLRARLRRS